MEEKGCEKEEGGRERWGEIDVIYLFIYLEYKVVCISYFHDFRILPRG